jgi:hypothetical protein
VYDIQKGNTNEEIKFYMGYNEERKGKVMKIPWNGGFYILFES